MSRRRARGSRSVAGSRGATARALIAAALFAVGVLLAEVLPSRAAGPLRAAATPALPR